MTRAVALSLGMAEPYGAILAEPQPGSPAAAAPYVNFRRLRTRRRISKLAHACCLVGRELAFDFLRAILCFPFLAGHWDVRNTVADKVYVAMEISVFPAHANTGDPNGPFEACPVMRSHAR